MIFLLMKSSRLIYAVFAGMLLPLLSGCFSTMVSRDAVHGKSDWFSPTALYESKANDSLAIEGTLTKAGEQNGHTAYLIIPQKILVTAHLQTKGSVSFKDISSLSPELQRELSLQKKLSGDYEKIADIRNQSDMNVNQRTTVNIKAVGLLPFAFIADAVTFPFQIYIGKKMSENPIE